MTSYFGGTGFFPEIMYNLRGLLTIILGYENSDLINMFSIFGFVFNVVATMFIWRGKYNPRRQDFELRLALTFLLGIFFNLHLYPHDGLMMVPPALLFLGYLKKRELPLRPFATIALIFPAIFFFLILCR